MPPRQRGNMVASVSLVPVALADGLSLATKVTMTAPFRFGTSAPGMYFLSLQFQRACDNRFGNAVFPEKIPSDTCFR